MSKMVEVKLTKCRLILYEHEFWKLPPDVLKAAIRRGKYVTRMDKLDAAILHELERDAGG